MPALMRAPNGETQEVDDRDIEHYVGLGAKVVQQSGSSSTAPAPGAARPPGSDLMDLLGRIETGAQDFGRLTSAGGIGAAGGFQEHPGFAMMPDSTQDDVRRQAMGTIATEVLMPYAMAPAHIAGSGLYAMLRRAPWGVGQGVRAVEAGGAAMAKTAAQHFGRGAQAVAGAAAPAAAPVVTEAGEATAKRAAQEAADAAEMARGAGRAPSAPAAKPRPAPKPKATQPVVAKITPKPGAPTTQPAAGKPYRPRGKSGPELARGAADRARAAGGPVPVRGGARPQPGDDLSKLLGNDAIQVARLRHHIASSKLPQSMKDQLYRQLAEDPVGMAQWLSQQGIAL